MSVGEVEVAQIYLHPHEGELFPVVLSSHLCICHLSVTEVNMLHFCAKTANLFLYFLSWYRLFVFLLLNPRKIYMGINLATRSLHFFFYQCLNYGLTLQKYFAFAFEGNR